MSLADSFGQFAEQFRTSAGVDSVFGDPITEGERTVVPVAKVAYGFGYGFGTGTKGGQGEDEHGESDADGRAERRDSGEGRTGGENEEDGANGENGESSETGESSQVGESGQTGEGGGGGGGAVATPVGVVELTADGTRFVRFRSRRRTAVAFGVGLVVGAVLGRRQ